MEVPHRLLFLQQLVMMVESGGGISCSRYLGGGCLLSAINKWCNVMGALNTHIYTSSYGCEL